MIGIIIWPFLILCAIVLYIYNQLLSRYLAPAREIKREIDNRRSPLIGSYGEINSGLIVLRAFKSKEYFYGYFEEAIDGHSRAVFMDNHTKRWIGMITELVGTVLIAGCAFFGIIMKVEFD